jgi:hypothetical protein
VTTSTFHLPCWLPPLVAERARAVFAAMTEAGMAEEDVAVVRRFTTDPRMEGVWKYFQRKRREGHHRACDYENPVHDLPPSPGRDRAFPPPFTSRATYMQNLAMGVFYSDILCLMTAGRINRFGGPYPTPPPLNEFVSQRCAQHRDLTEGLRAKAKLITTDPLFTEFPRELRKLERRLLQAADAYEELANAAQDVTLRQVPAAVTGYIARCLQNLFGHKMYGQAAVVASVILDRDVTPAEAREWCRKGWVKTHERRP